VVGWLVAWLLGWLVGWLLGWLVGWLFVGGCSDFVFQEKWEA